jgi:hypothetical protein
VDKVDIADMVNDVVCRLSVWGLWGGLPVACGLWGIGHWMESIGVKIKNDNWRIIPYLEQYGFVIMYLLYLIKYLTFAIKRPIY